MRHTNFTSVFIAVFIGTALVSASLILNGRRPVGDVKQPSASLVKATGKCAECHRRETSSVVHQYEMSQHAAKNVNCLDCHKPVQGQHKFDHKGFEIAKELTSKNCAECHQTEYDQFLRSRHAANRRHFDSCLAVRIYFVATFRDENNVIVVLPFRVVLTSAARLNTLMPTEYDEVAAVSSRRSGL